MTLRLIIVRHAKSSWKDPTLHDHARPLNGRGRRSATAIGQWLADRGHVPMRTLSSDSARTRETWARIAARLPEPPRAEWLSELYHAAPEALLDVLRGAGTASPLLLLGHNPGLAEAARRLVAVAPGHRQFERYPTAATTVCDVDVEDWARATWGGARVRDFVVPRELGVSRAP